MSELGRQLARMHLAEPAVSCMVVQSRTHSVGRLTAHGISSRVAFACVASSGWRCMLCAQPAA
jgi:hypothetical protein